MDALVVLLDPLVADARVVFLLHRRHCQYIDLDVVASLFVDGVYELIILLDEVVLIVQMVIGAGAYISNFFTGPPGCVGILYQFSDLVCAG